MENKLNELSTRQKLAAGGLAVFAVLAIIVWIIDFRSNVYGPFYVEKNLQANNGKTCPSGNCPSVNNNEELLSKDTDKDGLSDWEELNIYNTSPYLEDTDSDGYSDKDEINNGLDPNCPKGKDCYGADYAAEGNIDETKGGLPNQSELEMLNKLIESGEFATDLGINKDQLDQSGGNVEKVFSGESNAAQLREMLLGAGMDKNLLDQLSDEDLMSSYQEVLNQG